MADQSTDFPQTQWTLVNILKSPDKKQAARALEDLCARYWYPIYAYLRRAGRSPHDAEDLTQMLFHKVVAGDALQGVDRERGRLRSFLIGMLRQVLSRQARHDRAEKRGGNAMHFSLDEARADERYEHEPADTLDPERLYDRAWARQLLETVREKMRASFTRKGRPEVFEILDPYLGWDDAPAPFAELGVRLGSNEAAARLLVHRLRKKFRALLEAEIAETVTDPADVASELEWMRAVLRG